MVKLRSPVVFVDEQGTRTRAGKSLWKSVDIRRFEEDEAIGPVLGDLLAQGVTDLVIDGDDRFVHRVITAYLSDVSLRSRPLRFLPVGGHPLSTIAHHAQGGLDARDIAALLRSEKDTDWEVVSVRALKVTSSNHRSAHYGFGFGAGWWHGAFEAYHRSGRPYGASLARSVVNLGRDVLGSSGASMGAEPIRFTVDYRPMGESWRHLHVTSLSRGWLGVAGAVNGEACLRLGSDEKELLGQAVRGRVVSGLGTREPVSVRFERLHLQGQLGYVLDGELYGSSGPQVVEVCHGPRVYFLKPTPGLFGRVKDLLVATTRRD
jgi:hypothetical protein